MVLTVAWDGEFCGTSDRLICVSLGIIKIKNLKVKHTQIKKHSKED